MECEPRPQPGLGAGGADGTVDEGQWAQRSAVEHLSAAGQAPRARDRPVGEGEAAGSGGQY